VSKIILTSAALVGLTLAMFAFPVLGQVDTETQRDKRSTESSTAFEARFWQYLLSNNYKNWAPPAGQGGDFFTGESIHGQMHKLYLNRTAASDPNALVDESVIVMENYRSNKMLESISVMLRSAGSNPSQQDWYWITYGPDGSVIGTTEGNNSDAPVQRPPATSYVSTASSIVVGSSCTTCHRKAPGGDFVHFNDDDSRE
jgi:hypothetical protein